MDESSFATLFANAVLRSLQQAGLSTLKSELLIEFHGKPNPHDPITMDQALGLLWLSHDQFYLIVDVGVILDPVTPPLIFVRPSGHEPVPFSGTWDPDDLGPFKAIGPMTKGRPS